MIVAHPHPLHGGTMHNKVVFSIADQGVKSGWCTVRFNFRGVGKSTGKYDNLIGETEDLRTVIQYVLKTWQPEKIIVGGFSFGSRVTLKILEEGFLPNGVILCGLPVEFFKLQPLSTKIQCPSLFVLGDRDEFASVKSLQNLIDQSHFETTATVKIIEHADHFLNGKMHVLKHHVEEFLEKI